MPPKLDQRRRKTKLRLLDDPNESQYNLIEDTLFVQDRPMKRMRLPSPTTDSATTPAIDPTTIPGLPPILHRKPYFSISVAKANALDEATQTMPTATEAYVTLDNAPAPLFKIGEKVSFVQGGCGDRGGTILASEQMKKPGTFFYNISTNQPHAILNTGVKNVTEAFITSSNYTVGDVVLVEAFGKKVRRTILEVLVSTDGVFTYDVGSGFEARNEDVLELAGRRR